MKISVNTRRADLSLPQFDLPPAEPVFRLNPVAGLVITNTGGKITLKLRVPSPPAQYTLVQGAAPVRTGVRSVQHFPFLGLLRPPTAGATSPSFTLRVMACRKPARPFGFAPASTLTAGPTSERWPAPASPPQPHSEARRRLSVGATPATAVRGPVLGCFPWNGERSYY